MLIKQFFTLMNLLLLNSICLADADFDIGSKQLHVPFMRYQDKVYQGTFTFLSPNQLKLERVNIQRDIVSNAGLVPVYNDLSFHLSAIQVAGKKYSVDARHLGDNIFQLHQLLEVKNTEVGRTIFRSQHFSGSGICAQCHDNLEDSEGQDVSIVSTWQTTMMANATRDPFWQAKVKSELIRTPQLAETIQETCTRCHAPMANEEARKQQDKVQAVFGEGLLNPNNPYYDLSTNGVSCSLCHQISPKPPFGTIAGYSGNFTIDTAKNNKDRPIYGPYIDVKTMPMREMASFTPTFSEHISSSELCASCHDLTTPYTDEKGTILSKSIKDEFPEQTPYSEWLHSDFATVKSCQQCHMERANEVAIASIPQNLQRRNNFSQHNFLGANRLMLSILEEYREPLGVAANDFSKSIANVQKLLNSSVKLNIKGASLNQGKLNFNLIIKTEVGHKLPTGYPSRRVILHVTIRDSNKNIVFETGKVNADGSVVELDSDRNAKTYEPHYQKIETPQQVQVYETIIHDYKNQITYTLLRAKSYVKDNRLLPRGFNKVSASNKIKVRGRAETDENFIGGSDEIEFNLNNFPENQYIIEAELIYQTLGYAFAQDLFKETAPEITRFKQMFNASSLKSTSMGKTAQLISAAPPIL